METTFMLLITKQRMKCLLTVMMLKEMTTRLRTKTKDRMKMNTPLKTKRKARVNIPTAITRERMRILPAPTKTLLVPTKTLLVPMMKSLPAPAPWKTKLLAMAVPKPLSASLTSQ